MYLLCVYCYVQINYSEARLFQLGSSIQIIFYLFLTWALQTAFIHIPSTSLSYFLFSLFISSFFFFSSLPAPHHGFLPCQPLPTNWTPALDKAIQWTSLPSGSFTRILPKRVDPWPGSLGGSISSLDNPRSLRVFLSISSSLSSWEPVLG